MSTTMVYKSTPKVWYEGESWLFLAKTGVVLSKKQTRITIHSTWKRDWPTCLPWSILLEAAVTSVRGSRESLDSLLQDI